jgi:hypothetical protein
MKKKLLVAAMSAILVIGTAITSFADTYDPQYPLKGYMESWFVTSPVTGETVWKSDPNNFFYESNNHLQYALDLAIKNRDPLFLNSFGGIDLAVMAKLTDYPAIGLDGIDQGKAEHLTTEIRSFLNSFDWRNASDYEKAVRIAKRITQADYFVSRDQYGMQDGTQYAYGCLVEGKASCSGYDSAASMLAACVGLPISSLGSVNHTYPVFLVDGVWLAYEPTSKDVYFTVADVYEKNVFGDYQLLGEYSEGTGYEIPTLERVEAMFPDVRRGIIHGEQAPFIHFE